MEPDKTRFVCVAFNTVLICTCYNQFAVNTSRAGVPYIRTSISA